MISDEGQRQAASTMRDAAEMNLRAADMIQQAVFTLQTLIGEGYGNAVSRLVQQLETQEERRKALEKLGL